MLNLKLIKLIILIYLNLIINNQNLHFLFNLILIVNLTIHLIFLLINYKYQYYLLFIIFNILLNNYCSFKFNKLTIP